MRLSLPQIITSIVALVLALALLIFYIRNPAAVGAQLLLIRAMLVNGIVLSVLLALLPFLPLFRGQFITYFIAVCVPAMLPVLAYFLIILPAQGGQGVTGRQLELGLITDRSSNGIVEIGFSYPIFTPRISLANNELYTRQVMVFFELIDAEGRTALYRAVREEVPNGGLSVEASVSGMLRQNAEYLFNPLVLPPLSEVTGRVVFVVAGLDDGRSFTEALREATQARLQLRDFSTGTLLQELPVVGL